MWCHPKLHKNISNLVNRVVLTWGFIPDWHCWLPNKIDRTWKQYITATIVTENTTNTEMGRGNSANLINGVEVKWREIKGTAWFFILLKPFLCHCLRVQKETSHMKWINLIIIYILQFYIVLKQQNSKSSWQISVTVPKGEAKNGCQG